MQVPNCFCKKETGINQKLVYSVTCKEWEEGIGGVLGRRDTVSMPFLYNFDVLISQSKRKSIGGSSIERQWKPKDLLQISNRTKPKRERNN